MNKSKRLAEAVAAWKVAAGRAAKGEHRGWDVMSGRNRPCDGVYMVRGVRYGR